MGGAVKQMVGTVSSAMGSLFGTDGSLKAATSQVAPSTPTPSYSAGPELRGTQADANNAMDFQDRASRRRASGTGAQMLASSGANTNAGTKTLLGS